MKCNTCKQQYDEQGNTATCADAASIYGEWTWSPDLKECYECLFKREVEEALHNSPPLTDEEIKEWTALDIPAARERREQWHRDNPLPF